MAVAWGYPMRTKSLMCSMSPMVAEPPVVAKSAAFKPSILSKQISLVLLLAVSGSFLVSCGGGVDSARVTQSVDASKNGVTSIQLEDVDGYAHFKGSLQLNLVGSNDQNVTTNLNNKATWKLSDTSLGSIKNGLFTSA